MPTKKKATGGNSRDIGSPRVTRQQKKLVENGQVQANQVTELITSSARKKKVVGTRSRAIDDPLGATSLDADFRLVDHDGCSNGCLGYNDDHEFNASLTFDKGHDNGTSHSEADTVFSPSFHIPRHVGGELSTTDFYKVFQHGSQQFENHGTENIQINCPGGGGLSAESLQCLDENSQDHEPLYVCQEDEDGDASDGFDPYLFIKNLPELSSVVPTFRPVLLPKQTRSCPSTTLVLDLDETLVHSSLEPCNDVDFTFSVNFNSMDYTVYVRCRPHLRDFLETVSSLFEIIIFTASQSIYAKQLLDILDPMRKVFRHRVYRDSCLLVDGNYLKDLSVLGRDLARVIIIDNSPQAFGFQVDNGIPIESWFDDRTDRELLMLLPFLQSLVGVQDVRPLIAQKFNLRQKIAAADCPGNYSEGAF